MTRGITVCAVSTLLLAGGCNLFNRQAAKRTDQPLPNEKFDLAKEPPINAETRYAAGHLAESRGDWQRAVMQYEESLKLKPNQPETLNRLSVAYAMAREPDKAIATGQRYVDVTHGSAAAWNNLAQCYEFANRQPEAEAAYKSGIEKDPRSTICRTNYGLLLIRQGKVEDGREQMSVVLAPAEVHYNVASVLEMQNRKAEAKTEYQKALSIDPTFTDAKRRLAQIE